LPPEPIGRSSQKVSVGASVGVIEGVSVAVGVTVGVEVAVGVSVAVGVGVAVGGRSVGVIWVAIAPAASVGGRVTANGVADGALVQAVRAASASKNIIKRSME
jgi:hypothetical protein